MARYRGLCIGGPHDGDYLEHTGPVYLCREVPKQEVYPCVEGSVLDYITHTEHYYHYLPMARTKFGDEQGMWVHRNSPRERAPDAYDAVTELFESYAAKANRLRFIATCGIPLPEEEVNHAQTEPPHASTGSSGKQAREAEG